jgi:hypothetical protein
MTPQEAGSTLAELMRENGLTAETRLYRHQLKEHREPAESGGHRVTANPGAAEAVINVYGAGHLAVAETVGAGLAFTESQDGQWAEEGRVEIEVRLGDALDQGGLVYPVESVITERTWYLTLPSGAVPVRLV